MLCQTVFPHTTKLHVYTVGASDSDSSAASDTVRFTDDVYCILIVVINIGVATQRQCPLYDDDHSNLKAVMLHYFC